MKKIDSKTDVLNKKFHNASKWSFMTEILPKIIAPLTNMILARVLVPEAFGMVATITMITSFADIFSQAGFHQYLVQHNFKNEEEFDLCSSIAFWMNIFISLLLWILIFIFRNSIANAVGNSGLGTGIAVAALSLPITSFTSIQSSRFRKELNFKAIFYSRLVTSLIPLVITIPLAFAIKSYWALIIGNIVMSISNCVFLTLLSHWKPSFMFDLHKLKEMIEFCSWALCEQLLGWANLNIGVFIVGAFISEYYLGIYKTSMAMVNQIMAIIVNSLSPVLIATLSKFNESEKYYDFYYLFVKRIAMVILPMGIGIFVFRDTFTSIMLGSQWRDAIFFIGIWGIMRALSIVYGAFSMEVFISQGKPKIATYSQILNLIVLLPILLISAKMGFTELCIARSLINIWTILVEWFLLYKYANIKINIIIKDSLIFLFCSLIMGIIGFGLNKFSSSLIWSLIAISLCMVVYFLMIILMKKTRIIFFDFLNDFIGKKVKEI